MLLAAGWTIRPSGRLEFARAKWGDSPGITATIAWAHKQMAASESGTRQFGRARLDHTDTGARTRNSWPAVETSCLERS